MTFTYVAYTLVCLALFYTCFCRLVFMNRDTYPAIRLAFVALATVCLVCAALPFWVGYRPTPYDLLMPGSILAVQGVTARYWHNGAPTHFQRCAPKKEHLDADSSNSHTV